VVAYAATNGRVYVYDVRGTLLWRSRVLPGVRALAWSSDGRLLAVATRDAVLLRDDSRIRTLQVRGVLDAQFEPGTHRLALLRPRDVLLAGERVFAGAGAFRSLAWSPDGRWLLVTWPAADQWVFVRVRGAHRVEAVSHVTREFESATFPIVSGWCCSSSQPRS
jgi:hypothetical protein